MAYTNSPLAKVKLISPNKNSPRNHAIDTITIHCVVGQCSAKRIGEIFQPTSRQASSNYGIGFDGEIGLYVDERDRSWCTSSGVNDHRAITIEVASDTTHPYAVTDKAFAALLDLVTDICKRNGIKKLVWSTNKNDRVNHLNGCNMTVHRDYANKSCPGDYLYNRHGEIAAEVNKRLGIVPVVVTEPEKPTAKTLYYVQTGAFAAKGNADRQLVRVKAAGFDAILKKAGSLYKVQVGAYAVKANAEAMANKLIAAGYQTYITTNGGTVVGEAAPTTPTVAPVAIKVGDKVKCKAGVKTFSNGVKMASWVPTATLYVRAIESGGKIYLVSTEPTKAVYTGRVKAEDVTKI